MRFVILGCDYLPIHTEYHKSKSVSHAVPTQDSYIPQGPPARRNDIGRGLTPHVIQILISHVHYIIHFNFTSIWSMKGCNIGNAI